MLLLHDWRIRDTLNSPFLRSVKEEVKAKYVVLRAKRVMDLYLWR
jgi:hypothetical protein